MMLFFGIAKSENPNKLRLETVFTMAKSMGEKKHVLNGKQWCFYRENQRKNPLHPRGLRGKGAPLWASAGHVALKPLSTAW
jgi:hypothetical protein